MSLLFQSFSSISRFSFKLFSPSFSFFPYFFQIVDSFYEYQFTIPLCHVLLPDHALTPQTLRHSQIILFLLRLLLLLQQPSFFIYGFQYLFILFLRPFLQFFIKYFSDDFVKSLLVYMQYFIFFCHLVSFVCFLHWFLKLVALTFLHDSILLVYQNLCFLMTSKFDQSFCFILFAFFQFIKIKESEYFLIYFHLDLIYLLR